METRIIASNPNVSFATTSARVTPSPPSASKFGDVLASTAVQSAESAMTVLPGGPMMALAVRGGTASVPIGTTSSPLTAASTSGTKSAEGPTTTTSATGATGIPGLGGSGVTGTTTGIDPTASAAAGSGVDQSSIQSSLQQSADMNMYMLQVQQQVQQQGQQFTTLSNVMKAQYDTVKNAIGNIR